MKLKQLFGRTLEAPYLQLEENAASYCAERRGSALFLFFEQTNGATDWRNNLDFPAAPYKQMECRWYVHRGFLRVFKSIEPHIAPLVADKNVARIIISGYSHGAALALLCHEYCVYNRPDIAGEIRGYGFGCPRVLWGFPPKAVRERFRRFTVIRNCRDLVTHLPPRLFFYRHIGNILHIGVGRGENCIDSHRADNYLAALDDMEVKL